MGMELVDLVKEIREASGAIERSDTTFNKRLDQIETEINKLMKVRHRPGSDGDFAGEASQRRNAIELCKARRSLTVPKIDAGVLDGWEPSSGEIDEAATAIAATRQLFRHGNISRLDATYQKSLSSFSFGSNGHLLAPEMSNRIISCIVDQTDVSGLVDSVQISAGSVRMLVDNARMLDAGWACDASCFVNNPQPDLQEGLGQLEIKAETIRYVACATSDLLADAAFPVENWLLDKVSRGFRNTINEAIIGGDGIGKPLGFLNPKAGIPICDTSPVTPAGQFTWQDLVMLKYEVPMSWHQGCVYLMNQRTLALLLTMSDAGGRPLLGGLPQGLPNLMLAGSPIVIATQMPDVAPGMCPILFGNLKQTYLLVNRKAVTMLTDPFTAGYCTLFKFECRVGGGTLCPNASRLLRIK